MGLSCELRPRHCHVCHMFWCAHALILPCKDTRQASRAMERPGPWVIHVGADCVFNGALMRQAAELAGNVEALLLAVKATNDFEAEMAQRFGGGGGGGAASGTEVGLVLPSFLQPEPPTSCVMRG